jgi:pilus assembly protein Flp/PilA
MRSNGMNKLIRFFKEEEGATALEYALMVGLIAAVIVGAVSALGGAASESFTESAADIGD